MVMGLVSFLLAAGLGYWFGERLGDYLMIFYYHRNFLSEDRFMELYDINDQDFNFELFSDKDGKKLKKYADYLKKHQDARPKAYQAYISHLRDLLKHVALVLAVTLFIPPLFLNEFALLYISVYVSAIIGWILYRRFVKNYSASFYIMLMMNVIINHEK